MTCTRQSGRDRKSDAQARRIFPARLWARPRISDPLDLFHGGTDAFSYDALARLTSSSVAGVTRTYAYDGDGLLRSRTEGAVATGFLFDPSVTPAPLLQAGTERIVLGLGPLYRAHPDGSFDALARDALGSVRAEVSGAGKLTNAYDYTAYGALRASLAGPPLLGFAGELTDAGGLIYLRARWYDASAGRFLSSDPVDGRSLVPATLNRNSYARANPVNASDPSGKCTDPAPGAAGPRYCVSAFIPTPDVCVLGLPCYAGDNRGPLADGDTSRIELHILPDGSITHFSDITQRFNPDGTIDGRQANPSCAHVGRSAFRYRYYRAASDVDADLQSWLRHYNFERPHRGYRTAGRTPASIFHAHRPSLLKVKGSDPNELRIQGRAV